jgi:hypothetical protein
MGVIPRLTLSSRQWFRQWSCREPVNFSRERCQISLSDLQGAALRPSGTRHIRSSHFLPDLSDTPTTNVAHILASPLELREYLDGDYNVLGAAFFVAPLTACLRAYLGHLQADFAPMTRANLNRQDPAHQAILTEQASLTYILSHDIPQAINAWESSARYLQQRDPLRSTGPNLVRVLVDGKHGDDPAAIKAMMLQGVCTSAERMRQAFYSLQFFVNLRVNLARYVSAPLGANAASGFFEMLYPDTAERDKRDLPFTRQPTRAPLAARIKRPVRTIPASMPPKSARPKPSSLPAPVALPVGIPAPEASAFAAG